MFCNRVSQWFNWAGQGLKLEGVRESAAPRFLEGLLDFDWQGVHLTPKIKREAVPEPFYIQKWQTSF